jgi:cysteine-rich repeat protein
MRLDSGFWRCALVMAWMVPACGDGEVASVGATEASTSTGDLTTTGDVPTSTMPPTGTTGVPPTSLSEAMTSTTPPTTDGTTTDETTTDDTTEGTTEPLPTCGDGMIDPGEACDDGVNNGPGQPCNAMCQANACGDGDPGRARSATTGPTTAT